MRNRTTMCAMAAGIVVLLLAGAGYAQEAEKSLKELPTGQPLWQFNQQLLSQQVEPLEVDVDLQQFHEQRLLLGLPEDHGESQKIGVLLRTTGESQPQRTWTQYYHSSEPVLGLQLKALPAALKSQLKIAADRGVAVTGYNSEAEADLSKVFQRDDILLTANGAPLGKSDDLVAVVLKAGSRKDVVVNFLRAGEGRQVATIRSGTLVRSSVRKSFFDTVSQAQEKYVLGVVAKKLDELTRSLLKIGDDEGLAIKKVLPGGAAEEAGMKQHDIIMTVDDEPVASNDTLVEQLQDSGGAAITLSIMREGRRLSLEVTPRTQKRYEVVGVAVSPGTQGVLFQQAAGMPWTLRMDEPQRIATDFVLGGLSLTNQQQAEPLDTETLGTQLKEIRKAVRSLNRSIERLDEQLSKANEKQAKPADE